MLFQDIDANVNDAWAKRIAVAKTPDGPIYAKESRKVRTRLKLIGRKKISLALEIPDWLKRHGVKTPPSSAAPAWAPTSLHGNAFRQFLADGDARIALYGSEQRYLLELGEEDIHAKLGVCLDFGKWIRNGRFIPIADAKIVGPTIFVSSAINGYSREVGGKTGYLVALDRAGKVLWQAGPKVANGWSFAVVKDVVVCGFGFTREPDGLFVLDAATGRTLQRLPLSSAPEWIVHRDGKIFVRCYDAEYAFQIVGT